MQTSEPLLSRLIRFWRTPFHDKLHYFRLIQLHLKARLYYRHVFGAFGEGSILYKPLLLANPRFVKIGKNVIIQPGVRIEAIVRDPSDRPELIIGDNVNIQQNVQIVFMGKVVIADNVGIAANCSIFGASHPFFDVHDPVKITERFDGADSLTTIGAGSMLGANTVVQQNVRIGSYVIVGSNSSVKKNIPDYCVVAGDPATVVMRYDQKEDRWTRR